MAWHTEKTWFTYSSNVWLIGNINPSSITHTGSTLRVQGTIAAGARGSSNYGFYYLDYTSYAQPEGGSKIALGSKGYNWKVGKDDIHVNFDVTLSNVPATQTSRSFSVNFYGPNTNSVKATLSWTLNFSASGSAPTGGYNNYLSSTWDSISTNVGVSSWGGLDGNVQSIVVTGSTNGDAANATTSEWKIGRKVYTASTNSSTTSVNITCTDSNVGLTFNDPISIKGLLHYKLAYWNYNSVGLVSGLDDTLRYLPPAPCSLTYTDPGGDGTKVYPFVFTGDATKNHTTYDVAQLKRTVRYKVEGASDWTYVANNAQALIGAETTFNVSVPGSKSATVEGWMTYHGQQSEVRAITVYNGNPPSRVYGSVNGQSKLCNKLYGSVNGTSVEITKLYASVDGKSKSILG